jgi:hypothetical protein
MSTTITVTNRERALIVELLERDQGFLPHEIHHTDSREFRASLEERLELVAAVLAKLGADVAQGAAR